MTVRKYYLEKYCELDEEVWRFRLLPELMVAREHEEIEITMGWMFWYVGLSQLKN